MVQKCLDDFPNGSLFPTFRHHPQPQPRRTSPRKSISKTGPSAKSQIRLSAIVARYTLRYAGDRHQNQMIVRQCNISHLCGWTFQWLLETERLSALSLTVLQCLRWPSASGRRRVLARRIRPPCCAKGPRRKYPAFTGKEIRHRTDARISSTTNQMNRFHRINRSFPTSPSSFSQRTITVVSFVVAPAHQRCGTCAE